VSKKRDLDLMGGPLLPTCSRCASLVVNTYCGRCGERFEEPGTGAWFHVQVESTARRTAREAALLQKYPGEAQQVGARQTLTVGEAAHIDWLRTSAPRLLAMRNSVILAPGGRRIPSSDPVYSCAIGVMESGIRGCMTQKARAAHCAFESTILPLREPMKSLALADQLESAGRMDLAQELVIGALSRLHREGQKAYCPLFGRALRLKLADVKSLPMLISSALEAAASSPRLLPMADKQALPVSENLLKTAIPGDAVTLALTLKGRGRAIHPRAEGPYDSVDYMAGVVISRFATDSHQRMVDVIAPTTDGEMGKRLSLQADDVDIHRSGLAVLRADKQFLQITDHMGGEECAGSWQGGQLPTDVHWRVRRWRTGWYWVWSDSGALFLLSPERGWLLSSLSGEARGLATVPDCEEFSSVRGVVRMGKETAILSAGGHRLTMVALKEKGIPMGQPPLHVTQDLLLPHPAQAIGLGRGNRLVLHDHHLVYSLNSGASKVELLGTLEAGTAPSLFGGNVVLQGAGESRLMGPGNPTGGPSWVQLEVLLRQATDRHPNLESWTLLDRQGRMPHRTTWGG
jgi:hypothetical protein